MIWFGSIPCILGDTRIGGAGGFLEPPVKGELEGATNAPTLSDNEYNYMSAAKVTFASR